MSEGTMWIGKGEWRPLHNWSATIAQLEAANREQRMARVECVLLRSSGSSEIFEVRVFPQSVFLER